jgi:hypothetical protein
VNKVEVSIQGVKVSDLNVERTGDETSSPSIQSIAKGDMKRIYLSGLVPEGVFITRAAARVCRMVGRVWFTSSMHGQWAMRRQHRTCRRSLQTYGIPPVAIVS